MLLLLTGIRWAGIPAQTEKEIGEAPGVSVVIPARNEESNIDQLMASLNGLSYPNDKLELVIVDDASHDGTPQKLKYHAAQMPNVKLITLEDQPGFSGSYKKRALTCGIRAAKFPIIITSDADCQFNPAWIESLSNALISNDWILVSAPVAYRRTGPLAPLLEMELACLVAVGAVSLQAGRPNMCNGANLAFTREAFETVGGYRGFEHVPSGDDEFLLYKINQQFAGRVGFNKSQDALVLTEPPVSWGELINQRIRWGSKWKEHRSFTTRMLAMVIFFFHLSIAAVFILTIAGVYSWEIFIVQMLSKIIVEAWFLGSVLSFFGKRILWKWFFLMQLLYSFYAVLVGVVAQFKGFNWKNRQYA